MKLDCAVVKDLYVLYQENELSPEVREWVDSHLEGCKECSKIYQSGSSLPDIVQSEGKEPSKKLDERLMMKLKLSRLRKAIAFLVVIVLMILFNAYSQSRAYLAGDFDRYDRDMLDYVTFVDGFKSNRQDLNQYNKIAEDMERRMSKSYMLAVRNLNYIEKRNLKGLPRYGFEPAITTLIQTLNNRWESDNWSERDEVVYLRLRQEIINLANSIAIHANQLANSKFYLVDTKEIKKRYEDLNRLAKAYTEYNKLPEEIEIISEKEAKARIAYVLGLEDENIKIIPLSEYGYSFEIKEVNAVLYSGFIDAVNGKITSIHRSSLSKEGDIIGLDKVEEKARKINLKNLNKGFDIEVEHIKTSADGEGTPNTTVSYFFKVQTFFNGYKIFNESTMEVDGKTNLPRKFSQWDLKGIIVNPQELRTDIQYTPEQALEKAKMENIRLDYVLLDSIDKEAYGYEETRFIRSMFSGKYELVHVYKLQSQPLWYPKRIYINAITGNREDVAYGHEIRSYDE